MNLRSQEPAEDPLSSVSHLGNLSHAELLASLSEPERQEAMAPVTEAEAAALEYDWQFWARPNQLPPAGDWWRYWLVQAGRGFGKTRTGAETVRLWVTEGGYRIVHLVAPTAADARDVMVEGPAGLLNCFPPHQRPRYEPSKRLLTFHTGAVAHMFSADEPERLRGPQCECFWADEAAAWRFAEDAWDNLTFGFRLGSNPRGVITTTPKPIKLIRDIVSDPHTVVTRGSSYENRSNLAPAFFDSIIRKYEGTRLGRQELMAELLEDLPGALWTRAMIDNCRATRLKAEWVRIVVAIDPAVTSSEGSDETGIIVTGLNRDGHVYVLDDCSLRGTPAEWALAALRAYGRWGANCIIAEVNNGGDLVEANLRSVIAATKLGAAGAAMLPYRPVRASRGKLIRAEPVAALYEQCRVHHCAPFTKLEDQMCSYVPNTGERSPDRMDALVWAVYDLVVQPAEAEMTLTYSDPYSISPW